MPTPSPPVWSRAIAALLAAQHYRSQAAFIAAARKRKIRIRPNTLSDAMRADATTLPSLETLQTIAAALDVPLWALCCEPEEYAVFTAALGAQDQAFTDAFRQQLLGDVATLITDRFATVERARPQPVKMKRRA